jgi:Uma2 family endonuclease
MELLIEPRAHLWTRGEYYKMAEAGLFEGRHVELIEGQVIEMSPMGSLHATAVALTARVLEKAFGQDAFVRWQMPLATGETSEPEPDVAVVAGDVRDYRGAHPATAIVVVEVADTSLAYDRTHKASVYAKAGIADYWTVNLIDRQLEVHRGPRIDAARPFGFGYADVKILSSADSISPLSAPQVTIRVADLLP